MFMASKFYVTIPTIKNYTKTLHPNNTECRNGRNCMGKKVGNNWIITDFNAV